MWLFIRILQEANCAEKSGVSASASLPEQVITAALTVAAAGTACRQPAMLKASAGKALPFVHGGNDRDANPLRGSKSKAASRLEDPERKRT